ncbi:MAG: hypothetical protein RBR68_13855 [Tenuifilaceae bacterium]|jgi:hypothetical protein|nr:hypothetical protein [Tenuifilaceae bacterium]
MAAKKNWISGAIKKPGSFTKQAKRAGMTVSKFAKSVLKPGSKATETTKRRARLALSLKSFKKKK